MSNSVTLGGERLGSGNKNKVKMQGFNRSTFNMGYKWRSSASSGTLIPFLDEIALPGDSFEIKLDTNVMTLPTIGPLFGSYKVQLDVFLTPLRLYNADLHMNKLEIGNDMSQIKFPRIRLQAENVRLDEPDPDNQQINSSCIFKYLGIAGLGYRDNGAIVNRRFNASSYLAYWDIFKNYYAHKQETNAFVIHTSLADQNLAVQSFNVLKGAQSYTITEVEDLTGTYVPPAEVKANIISPLGDLPEDWSRLTISVGVKKIGVPGDPELIVDVLATDFFANIDTSSGVVELRDYTGYLTTELGLLANNQVIFTKYAWDPQPTIDQDVKPTLWQFPLKNIDTMRTRILQNADEYFNVDTQNLTPYSLALESRDIDGREYFSKAYSQEGLAVKTYQSDLFNNWVNTEWLDGANGVNEISKVTVTDDSFSIDELNLSYKIHKMLMRVAVSGGTYKDWQTTMYDHDLWERPESPVYQGGLIKELAFQEVISNSESLDQPLGTLAGRGRLTSKNKGGYVKVKVNEPSILTGIFSLTPRIDYSQGNKWHVNLDSFADLHTPNLSGLGFQDLITDQMAWFDTEILTADNIPQFKSAGKTPAWINYMTNVNVVRGSFAKREDSMFMVNNRRYEFQRSGNATSIRDLTTYIDPTKFNFIFADTRLDAQNFWVQIDIDMKARRKMSSAQIPNL